MVPAAHGLSSSTSQHASIPTHDMFGISVSLLNQVLPWEVAATGSSIPMFGADRAWRMGLTYPLSSHRLMAGQVRESLGVDVACISGVA